MNKKSQIIYFMLIGIVVATTIVGLFILNKSEISASKLDKYKKEIVIDESLKPIHNFLTFCFKNAIMDSIIIVFQNGGELNITGVDYNLISDDADYISSFAGKNIFLYKYTYGKGITVKYRDPEKIRDNIITLSLPRIVSCIDSAEERFPQVKIEKKKDPKISLFLREDSVVSGIEFPLNIVFKNINRKQSMDKFYIELDARVMKIINSVNAFLTYLQSTRELENQMWNYFSFFQGISEDRFPPKYGVSDKMFVIDKQKLYNLFRNIMLGFASRLKVMNTLTFPTFSVGMLKLTPFLNFVDLYVNLYPPLDAKFIFKMFPDAESPIYIPTMSVSKPPRGGIPLLTPLISAIFSSPKMEYIYRAAYTFAVPLIVIFSDPYSFSGEGLSFKFAILPAICRSEPCNVENEIREDMKENKMYCNAAPKGSLKFKLKEFGSDNVIPLSDKDAIFIYSCGDYECSYDSDQIRHGGRYYFLDVPYCFNGSLNISVEGYMPKAVEDITLTPSSEKDLGNIKLMRFRIYPSENISVKVYKMKDLESLVASGHRYEEIINTLISESESIDFGEYFITIMPSSEDSPVLLMHSNTVDLENTSFILGPEDNLNYNVMYFIHNLSLKGCLLYRGERMKLPYLLRERIANRSLSFDWGRLKDHIKENLELPINYSGLVELINSSASIYDLYLSLNKTLFGLRTYFLFAYLDSYNLSEDVKSKLSLSGEGVGDEDLEELKSFLESEVLNNFEITSEIDLKINQTLDYYNRFYEYFNEDSLNTIFREIVFFSLHPLRYYYLTRNSDDFVSISGIQVEKYPIMTYNLTFSIFYSDIQKSQVLFVVPFKPILDMCDFIESGGTGINVTKYGIYLKPIFIN